MKKMPLRSIFLMFPVALTLYCIPSACIGSDHAPSAPRIANERAATKSAEGAGALFDAVGGMLSDLKVDPAVAGEFNRLYERNSVEISRLFADNPDLIWEAFEVAYDVLPAFRNLNREGGRLHVEKGSFSRAMLLFGELQALASPQLEADIKRAMEMVQSRTSYPEAERVLVDLGR